MNWSNVKLILFREIRDQLRDRRTLFVIAVVPILLYPLLWMSFLQVAQFMRDKPSKVLIVGKGNLPKSPPLVEGREFASGLFGESDDVRPGELAPRQRLQLHFAGAQPPGDAPVPPHPQTGARAPVENEGKEKTEEQEARTLARAAVEQGQYDAAVYFPPDFAGRLEAFRQAIRYRLEQTLPEEGGNDGHVPDELLPSDIPKPEIFYSTATEKSQIAFARVSDVLGRWRQELVKQELVAVGLPRSTTHPFEVQTADVAEGTGRRGTAMWSKVLPVLLLVWAMTGAFYPSVDLCAGEKERGTLETLLCSPAERSEIVVGKLLTIMLFSMATAVWNLVTMGASGSLFLARLPGFGPPPAIAAVWLSIALVPVSALFSALSLALAAFARSTKEGQYYFLPLLVITMPLVVLPMAPGVELNLGNSLIPVTGLVLLLRSMLEGNFSQDWLLALPVAAVTLGCCLLAIRWAVDQFNSESVLFRESERLNVGLWLRHLRKDRQPTPSLAEAVFCGAVILLAIFFLGASAAPPRTFRGLGVLVLTTQLAAIAAPVLLMTATLTTSPRQTLLLRRPAWRSLLAAAGLAVVLHPAFQVLQSAVMRLYPPSAGMLEALKELQGTINAAPLWQVVLLLALTPAICEELAFRGFILSGFRHLGRKWRAILYSALFFGLSHAMIFQQQLIACLVGVLIGLLAVQSGSILPGMIFHVVYNTVTLSVARLPSDVMPRLLERRPVLGCLLATNQEGQMLFRWPAVTVGALIALGLLLWFQRLPYPKSHEEEEREALLRPPETES